MGDLSRKRHSGVFAHRQNILCVQVAKGKPSDLTRRPLAYPFPFTFLLPPRSFRSNLTPAPEPAAIAFAVAAFTGLRHGEIQRLLWENYHGGDMYVSRSIWNGRISDPKTRKSRAPVPVIGQLADRLELHRLRNGSLLAGPIFANGRASRSPLAAWSIASSFPR